MTNLRVKLEPELEALAGQLAPYERYEMAAKLRRWAHQLEISARILSKKGVTRPIRLKRVSLGKLKLN